MFLLKHVLPVSVFFVSFFVTSQDKSITIPEFEKLITEAQYDTTKVRLHNELANEFYKISNIKKSIEHSEIALNISKNKKDENGIIKSLERLSYFNRKAGNFKISLKLINEALAYVNNKPKHKLFNTLYWEKCNIYSALQEYDSLEITANKLLNSTSDKRTQSSMQIFLAEKHYAKDQFKEAIEKYILARELAHDIADIYMETSAIVNIANIYLQMNNINEALMYIDESIKLSEENNLSDIYTYSLKLKGNCLLSQNKLDEALKILGVAYDVLSKRIDARQLTSVANDQADVYVKKGDFSSAVNKYHEVLRLEKDKGATRSTEHAVFNLASIYYNLNQVDSAFFYLDATKQIFKKGSQRKQGDYHELLSKLYADKGEYDKAYKNYTRYMVIRDSLDSIQHKKEAYILEAKYQADKKEQEIVALNANNKVKSLQLYLSLGFGVIVLLLLFILYNRFKVNKKSKKDLEELDKAKSRFFANISHEFRTPLTLIMGIIQKRLNDSGENNVYDLHMALRNSQRLKTLIDQLLDLSKIEFNKMPLSVEKVNLHNFLKFLHAFFITKAQEKNIVYTLEINNVCDEGFIDIDKVEKIVINLLSNAFKFTPKGEKIHVKAVINTQELCLSVKDTGIGLSEEASKKVFDRFYQADDSSTRNTEGSGIGLALSKELAELHKGKLALMSVKDEGSEFVLYIPINKKAFNKNEFKIEKVSGKNKLGMYKNISSIEPITGILQDNNDDKPWVLVVEDSADMQKFIYSILKDEYSVILASHGEEAFKLSTEKVPNVIISDYMMPGMDGIEFCKKIKENMITSHIPVIMLTAKAGQDNKIEGLENGADIYLTKPFDQKELMLHIRNLIAQFQRLDELFKNQKGSVTILPNFPSKEKTFLNKIYTVLEEKFHLEDYGIDQLADDLFLSRMQVYRKIKALTGKSPGDVLRNFRIERAKQLLEISSLTISEVAIKTGYKNQSNFSRIFKECTGVTPSEYVKNQKRPFIS